jgi:hypothetical protein
MISAILRNSVPSYGGLDTRSSLVTATVRYRRQIQVIILLMMLAFLCSIGVSGTVSRIETFRIIRRICATRADGLCRSEWPGGVEAQYATCRLAQFRRTAILHGSWNILSNPATQHIQ